MKNKLNAHSAALAEAIHYTFSGSAACHCHTDAKLSEAEMLDALCQRGLIHYADAGKLALSINIVLSEALKWGQMRAFETQGVKYLPQLQEWAFADLLALPESNVRIARRIEFIMSRYGLALKDGDPSRYRQLFEEQRKVEQEPEPDGRPTAVTPDQERAKAARELVKIAQRMAGQSASLMNTAVRLSDRKKVAGGLINAVRAADRINQDGAVLAGVISRFERQETAIKKIKAGCRKAVKEQGKVVTGAFAPTDNSPEGRTKRLVSESRV